MHDRKRDHLDFRTPQPFLHVCLVVALIQTHIPPDRVFFQIQCPFFHKDKVCIKPSSIILGDL